MCTNPLFECDSVDISEDGLVVALLRKDILDIYYKEEKNPKMKRSEGLDGYEMISWKIEYDVNIARVFQIDDESLSDIRQSSCLEYLLVFYGRTNLWVTMFDRSDHSLLSLSSQKTTRCSTVDFNATKRVLCTALLGNYSTICLRDNYL